MKKIYQTEWQNIKFADFVTLSENELAGSEFYQAFYKVFFQKYKQWNDIPAQWRSGKTKWADFIGGRIQPGSKVLSVGCGLGFVEHLLHQQHPEMDLYIHEVAPSAWKWISEEVPKDHQFIGMMPECMPTGIQFDTIYLGTIDYTFDDESLIGFLQIVRSFLTKDGKCLLVSASFLPVPETPKEMIVALLRNIKGITSALQGVFKKTSKGQFWGWKRSRKEYLALMQKAGFKNLEDGFFDGKSFYWVEGHP